MSTYYIHRNGTQIGPYTEQQFQEIASVGGIGKEDFIYSDKIGRWIPYKEMSAPFVDKSRKSIASDTSPSSSKRKPVRTEKRNRFKTIGLPIIIISFMALIFFIFGSQNPGPGRSGKLVLGDTAVIASAAVGPDGGIIYAKDNNLGLEGFSINVPAGAYNSEINFVISAAQIKRDTFGNDFEAASPLISIDNGQVFSNEPLLVTIPIEKTDDEFAMGFYYNRQSGELEGIPFVDLNNESITLFTSHFSDIVVSKIPNDSLKEYIAKGIDTGFRPYPDGFQMPNYGSYLAPDGHCAGQSIAVIYYYNNIKSHGELRSASNIPLWGLFDNNRHIRDVQATPDIWFDDSMAIRLCSALQSAVDKLFKAEVGSVRIDSPEYYNYLSFYSYRQKLARDDELTFYTFAYSMQLTKKPQLVFIYRTATVEPDRKKRAGHAMVAYKIEQDNIFIYDPNTLAEERKIVLDRRPAHTVNPPDNKMVNQEWWYLGLDGKVHSTDFKGLQNRYKSGDLLMGDFIYDSIRDDWYRAGDITNFFDRHPVFEPYNGATTAGGMVWLFDRIGYFGESALYDRRVVASYFRDLIRGDNVAKELFPEDVIVEVIIGRDSNGTLITTELTDNLALTAEGTASIQENSEGILFLRVKHEDKHDNVSLHMENTGSQLLNTQWKQVRLERGQNDIGILHLRSHPKTDNVYHFVNFQRFNVVYGQDDTVQIEDQPAQAESIEGYWVFVTTVQYVDPEIEKGLEEGIFTEEGGYIDPHAVRMYFQPPFVGQVMELGPMQFDENGPVMAVEVKAGDTIDFNPPYLTMIESGRWHDTTAKNMMSVQFLPDGRTATGTVEVDIGGRTIWRGSVEGVKFAPRDW